MPFCSQCGQQNATGRFCMACGTPLVVPAAAPAQPQAAPPPQYGYTAPAPPGYGTPPPPAGYYQQPPQPQPPSPWGAPPAGTMAGDTGKVLAIVGGGVAVLGAVLPWTRSFGGFGSSSTNSLDVPITVLFSDTGSDSFKLGWLLLLLALGAVGVAAGSAAAALRRAFGAAIAVLTVWFLVRLQMTFGDFGVNLTDVVSIGEPVTIVGGLMVLFAPAPRQPAVR